MITLHQIMTTINSQRPKPHNAARKKRPAKYEETWEFYFNGQSVKMSDTTHLKDNELLFTCTAFHKRIAFKKFKQFLNEPSRNI